ncbi:MAG: hypothetical protein ACRC92_25950 [Peptostreptococcaceae bacterium]
MSLWTFIGGFLLGNMLAEGDNEKNKSYQPQLCSKCKHCGVKDMRWTCNINMDTQNRKCSGFVRG